MLVVGLMVLYVVSAGYLYRSEFHHGKLVTWGVLECPYFGPFLFAKWDSSLSPFL